MAPQGAPTRIPWNGVNLGGWLSLEPGPASELFRRHPQPGTDKPWCCEWDLMTVLHEKGVVREVMEHRNTFICKRDFEIIRAAGLNAVRLPFGYWIVLGPGPEEPYIGPALECIDHAVAWAEEVGLQIVLDLHGAPGCESGDPPCGRSNGDWGWTQWRFPESLRALELVARRYCNSRAVTGVEVCNEPSNQVPLDQLLNFYDAAVTTVRGAGMQSSEVTIVLPVFQRPLVDVAAAWHTLTGGRHANVCFDLHYYHCFGNTWHGMSLAQSLRALERARELQLFPTVVGEWSLALGRAASRVETVSEKDVRTLFGRAQIAAYKQASHGMFFWSYKDSNGVQWDWRGSYAEGALSGEAWKLPHWDGVGEDSLEEWFDPSPSDPFVHFGDVIYLRTYRGHYVDVTNGSVNALCHWKGDGARFVVCHPASDSLAMVGLHGRVCDGAIVCLRSVDGGLLSAASAVSTLVVASDSPKGTSEASFEFSIHIVAGGMLRHRSSISLRSRTLATWVGIDESDNASDNAVRACREKVCKSCQFVVEKFTAVPPQPLNLRACMEKHTPIVSTPARNRAARMSPSPAKNKKGKHNGMVLEAIHTKRRLRRRLSIARNWLLPSIRAVAL